MDNYIDLKGAEVQLVYDFYWCSLDEKKQMLPQIISLCDDILKHMIWSPAFIESDDWETGKMQIWNPHIHDIVEGTVWFNMNEELFFQKLSFNQNVFWDDLIELETIFKRWIENMVNIFKNIIFP
jgi:hypothetical protein